MKTATERSHEEIPWGDERPKTRGDCIGRPRPCPWVGCRYHLLVDVNEQTGTFVVNAGRTTEPGRRGRTITRRVGAVSQKHMAVGLTTGREPHPKFRRAEEQLFTALESAVWTDAPTCALDLAAEGALTLERTGEILNVTRERMRQIEEPALVKLRTGHTSDLLEESEALQNRPVDAWEAAGL